MFLAAKHYRHRVHYNLLLINQVSVIGNLINFMICSLFCRYAKNLHHQWINRILSLWMCLFSVTYVMFACL